VDAHRRGTPMEPDDYRAMNPDGNPAGSGLLGRSVSR
jgi:hypothetical protein